VSAWISLIKEETTMSLKMDLSEKGLYMFFKPYQVDALKALWNNPTGMSSKQVWEAIGSNKISRASVINFLQDAAENGLLDKHEITGKGGHRGIYHHKYTESEFKQHLATAIIDKLITEYPETTTQATNNI